MISSTAKPTIPPFLDMAQDRFSAMRLVKGSSTSIKTFSPFPALTVRRPFILNPFKEFFFFLFNRFSTGRKATLGFIKVDPKVIEYRFYLLSFDWLVHLVECQIVSTTNCNLQKG